MKLRRRLFNIACSASSLVGLLALVFWVRSHRVADTLTRTVTHYRFVQVHNPNVTGRIKTGH
jgi:hypothetical protein